MAPVLTLLFIGCLLKSVWCNGFNVILPKTIEALNGSCVSIPCSFKINSLYENDLDNTCQGIWKVIHRTSHTSQDITTRKEMIGDLKTENCTTTFSTALDYNNAFQFRLQCNNSLKYTFWDTVSISVKALPPSPTLTPPTLIVTDGQLVNLTCSAPVPCPSLPPTLTWTPRLGDSQETLKENQDKTKVMTSTLTFTASHLHHGKTISCTATYNKQHDPEVAAHRSLTAHVSFAPQILRSSYCTKAPNQVNCSCEATGVPPPTLHWYLDGLLVNNSVGFGINKELLNNSGLRSTITVNQPQRGTLSDLVCQVSNSLGAASHRFCISLEQQISAGSQVQVSLSVFVPTVGVLVVLVCALLILMRIQHSRHKLPEGQCTGDTITSALYQIPTRNNEAANAADEAIYSSVCEAREEKVPRLATSSEPPSPGCPDTEANNTEEASRNSKKRKDSDVIYSDVKWKAKRKKQREDSVVVGPFGSSYLEEEMCTVGDMSERFLDQDLEMGIYDEGEARKVEYEYAEVKFRK
ncbi:sialic acid-binding Ig-like lectin 10 [Echeneis naucrates]|uniref:sialic acid-binding Ig-like lectin 10 n=1 Tax=Echeneis naucrates TaxID=173247 RepID=UPI001113DF89|nr:sialic acid-binding Ig-like lectin 10 [Echeneis naucrates]